MATATAPGRRLRGSVLAAAAALVALEAIALGAVAVRAEAGMLGEPRTPIVPAIVAVDEAVVELGLVTGPAPQPAPEPRPARVIHTLVAIERGLPITSRPGGGRVLGTMPVGSRFYGEGIVAWVREISDDGRFGLVDVPYVAAPASGWIALRGLERDRTRISVVADVSEHRITVYRGEQVLFRAPAATGAPSSPTPTGRYFVTDRVPFPAGHVLGTFAFGISGIQPNLPAGWDGGDQLAIHGTNAPSTIGTSSSAGCLRVSERVLDRLQPLLRLGTPVIVEA